MKRFNYISFLLIIILAAACKEKFSLPASEANNNFLVVEGYLEANGVDSTIIKLSRTVKLSDGSTVKPEIGAMLTLEGTNGRNPTFTQTMSEIKAGTYYTAPLPTSYARLGQQCRIRIKTKGGQEYLSDYVDIKPTPVIDKLSWVVKSNGVPGVEINISTHDDTKNSVYYKWDFKETFMFNSAHKSLFSVQNSNRIIQRDLFNNDIYTCWRTVTSTAISLGSSARLDKDVIANAPVTLIPQSSEKTGIRYSVLVRQISLTENAFNFWQNMKKNTEQVGSIFDAQPSQLQGNIHNSTNAQEIVIGFLSAGSSQTKRIFIDNSELPRSYQYVISKNNCAVDSVRLAEVSGYFYRTPAAGIPISAFYDGDVLKGYTASSPSCVDCTTKGTNRKPAFWQ